MKQLSLSSFHLISFQTGSPVQNISYSTWIQTKKLLRCVMSSVHSHLSLTVSLLRPSVMPMCLVKTSMLPGWTGCGMPVSGRSSVQRCFPAAGGDARSQAGLAVLLPHQQDRRRIPDNRKKRTQKGQKEKRCWEITVWRGNVTTCSSKNKRKINI